MSLRADGHEGSCRLREVERDVAHLDLLNVKIAQNCSKQPRMRTVEDESIDARLLGKAAQRLNRG